jgi:hypothetical protein
MAEWRPRGSPWVIPVAAQEASARYIILAIDLPSKKLEMPRAPGRGDRSHALDVSRRGHKPFVSQSDIV